jgi:hypothetical protein
MTKQLIITVVGLGACTGAFLQLAPVHGQNAADVSQNVASAKVLKPFPGYASPEKALQSLGWAAEKGDLELLRDGVTPEIQKRLHQEERPDLAAHAIGVGLQLGSAAILNKQVVSDELVVLSVLPKRSEKPWTVRMQKDGHDWKLAGLEM